MVSWKFIKRLRYYARSDWAIELQNLCSIVSVNTKKSYVTVPVKAEERDKNFSNFDIMPAFGLEMSEGEDQRGNKANSK